MKSFASDENDTLKWVQHDLWFGRNSSFVEYDNLEMPSCLYIFYFARDVYLSKLEASPLFYSSIENLADIKGLDHRVLQIAHGLITDYYRWLHRHDELPVFGKDKASYQRYLKDTWVTYLRYELESLASESDEFVTAVVNAVGYQNTEAGYKAEDQLYNLLKARYQGTFSEAREQWIESEKAGMSLGVGQQ